MATKSAKAKIKQPFDTEANWNKSTRILLYGEKAYAQMSNGAIRSKTGTGAKAFKDLPYDDEAIYKSLAGKNGTIVSSVKPTGQSTNDTWLEVLTN